MKIPEEAGGRDLGSKAWAPLPWRKRGTKVKKTKNKKPTEL